MEHVGRIPVLREWYHRETRSESGLRCTRCGRFRRSGANQAQHNALCRCVAVPAAPEESKRREWIA